MIIRTAVHLALMFLAWNSVGATTIRVPEDYSAIEEALAVAVAGDTVLVGAGVWSTAYPGYQMVDGVTLKSSDGPEVTFITMRLKVLEASSGTVIEGFTFYWHGAQIICDASSPLIRGNVFDIQDPCPSNYDYIGVECKNGASPRIEGNVFDGNCGIPETSFTGVDSEDSAPVIVGNEFRHQTGVEYYGSSSSARVIGNVFNECFFALGGSSEGADTVRGNHFENSRYAINCGGGDRSNIVANWIHGSEASAFAFTGGASPVLRRNVMESNSLNVSFSWYLGETVTVDCESNWWGTIVEDEIEASIEVQSTAEGCSVDFDPWCLDPECESTPVLDRSWGALKKKLSSRAE
jgi:hypothetical protein